MGYSTDFTGEITLTPALTAEQVKYINTFCNTRRMKRDVKVLQDLYKGEYGFNGSYGHEGAYFAKDDGQSGQSRDKSILDYNEPAGTPPSSPVEEFNKWWALKREMIQGGKCQPGLWCQWQISEDGTTLEWNGGEKFYNYIEWLQYLITHFFNVYGTKLNGEIFWDGEDPKDLGKIEVIDSIITVKEDKIIYE